MVGSSYSMTIFILFFFYIFENFLTRDTYVLKNIKISNKFSLKLGVMTDYLRLQERKDFKNRIKIVFLVRI